jgi:hypothetical protein
MQSPSAALLLSGCARMGCIKFRRFFAKVNDVLTRGDKAAARGDLRACRKTPRRNPGSRAARALSPTLPNGRSFRTNSRRDYDHSRL